jgi:hypothetical protein
VIAKVLFGLATGATAGGATMTAGAIVLRSLEPARDAGFAVLTAGIMSGVAVAGTLAAALTRGVEDAWRRGAAAIVAAFGACLLALVAAPADLLAGRAGLASYGVLLLGVAAWSWHRARRTGAA